MNILFVIHKYGVPLDDPCCYPLGAMYISSSLKKLGHNVLVLNYNLFDYNLERELEGADVVLFTGFEEFLPLIKRDAARCKKRGIKTIVGGALATFKPSLMAGICDTVVVGEGEGVLASALSSIGVLIGKEQPIDSLPYPDYYGFGVDEYNRRHSLKYIGVLTSRGCPHNCTFCAHTCKFRLRKLENVFAEIDTYQEKYGSEYIIFNDNTFNINKKRTIEICKGMGERGLSWSAALRLDNLDDELCAEMAANGCGNLVVGVESFSQRYLDQMKKGLNVKQIKDALDLLKKHGLPYYGNILFGLNGQSSDDIARELSNIEAEEYNIFPVMVRPFVGTSEGRYLSLSEDDWHYWDDKFKAYIESKGKYCYPELEAVC